MALTGHLSDLSLSELIEFFCNQRKTGRLKVSYPKGSGHFYLQTGSVIDAKIGVLRGIDAVYYALTLPNASFEFSASSEKVERTINQPWTQVVLEGLRRLDEGITPAEAFPEEYTEEVRLLETATDESESIEQPPSIPSEVPSILSFVAKDALARRKPFVASAVAIAVLASIAAAGVPAGWYDQTTPPVRVGVKTAPPTTVTQPTESTPESPPIQTSEAVAPPDDDATLAAKRQRERERVRRALALREGASATQSQTETSGAAKQGAKKITVTVTYDESGRVTQASGSDPTALRIARQKRFPPGKAGSATVTIPIN